MPRTYNEGLIICPFYKAMAEKSITCEGITDECILKLIFTSPAVRDVHRKVFCEAKYKNCEVCEMLEAKYE